MFGNWPTVFLISKYGTVYFLLCYSLLTGLSLLRAPFTIEEVVASMTNIGPVRRLDAKEAKDRLGDQVLFYGTRIIAH
jgi:hypothetical protein